MPKLILQYEGRVLKEFPVGSMVTIGRLPGNSIVIDNPAVSSKHAKVTRDGDGYVIEDAESTNGTFVNEIRVTRQALNYGDLVLIGKHHLVFEEGGEDTETLSEALREVADLGGTVYLDTKRQKELLAQAKAKQSSLAAGAATAVATAPAETAPAARASVPAAPAASIGAPAPDAARVAKAPAAASAPSPSTVGMLYVLAGKTDQSEYALKAQTCLIGKSDSATVRLKGWFKPKTALAIARKGNGYMATPLGGKNLLNNQPLAGRQDLRDGDVLQVSGVTLEFRLME